MLNSFAHQKVACLFKGILISFWLSIFLVKPVSADEFAGLGILVMAGALGFCLLISVFEIVVAFIVAKLYKVSNIKRLLITFLSVNMVTTPLFHWFMLAIEEQPSIRNSYSSVILIWMGSALLFVLIEWLIVYKFNKFSLSVKQAFVIVFVSNLFHLLPGLLAVIHGALSLVA